MPNCKKPQPLSRPMTRSHPDVTVRSPNDAMSVSGEPIRILRLARVLDVTGLGKTKLYELQAAGHFPMRVQITSHSVGWVEQEVQTWLAHRVAARL
ncbi:MAG TPA: AlpA family phage regulatory protein [Steroidobacteraceae bacterium]|jgi:prophage regulatory protein|nr:AlpA family phage regulatory protein [Steroidobacteraceae bacterium]